MKKTIKYLIPAIVIAGIFVFIFKIKILTGFGNYLIDIDEPRRVDVAFVLGGNSFDRGTKAFELYDQGFCTKIVCLGGNVPSIFTSIGINKTEGQISRDHIVKNLGARNKDVIVLSEGTSTLEESNLTLEYCLLNEITEIIVVSDLFHTNRIRGVFSDKFKDNGIDVLLVGTPSSVYEENNWWTTEAGLIMLNNEYVKTLYYWLKY